ncbi:MAG TPA: amino acid ABC transporter ATP-binding protein, partial [Candidatus Kapabacteria bacterium]|nr:amino acid ABC transporter ATP-binding protein [Candidatus Kapabacteria bacterium]
RVFFMADGSILESGPPSVVLHNPANERTRRFLHQEQLLE